MIKKSVISGLLIATCMCPIHNAVAQIPVTDVAAESSLITQIKHQIEMVTYLEQQLAQLENLASLASIAGTTLGDTVSPELNSLFRDMATAYSTTNRTYGSLMTIPSKIDSELALFQPPPNGWQSMTVPQLIKRAQDIKKLTDGTNSAAIARQADVIQRRAELAAQAARANGMADRSVSALSATQAVAQQMRVTGQILSQIEQTNSDMENTLAAKARQEGTDKAIADGLRKAGQDAWKRLVDTSPTKPRLSPLSWPE